MDDFRKVFRCWPYSNESITIEIWPYSTESVTTEIRPNSIESAQVKIWSCWPRPKFDRVDPGLNLVVFGIVDRDRNLVIFS